MNLKKNIILSPYPVFWFEVYILCKINLAIILYGSVNPHQILHFIFSIEIEAPITRQRFPCKRLQNFQGSACDNVTLDFEASVQKGHF